MKYSEKKSRKKKMKNTAPEKKLDKYDARDFLVSKNKKTIILKQKLDGMIDDVKDDENKYDKYEQ